MVWSNVSVIISAVAVITTGAIQLFTVRTSRANTVATLRASLVEDEWAKLREALAEYMHLSYEIDTGWNSYKFNRGGSWPGALSAEVMREDQLYTTIRLLVDPGPAENQALLQRLGALRDLNSDEVWLDRRDELIAATVAANLAAESRAINGY